ncbi:putative germin-like protein 2-1 [Daucus carota subsp. sativus]|uniref:putative germin-like protein 2-1 n=1 Tax=Daucus carota subsp. sativus TaxID=79200 RepID=UPI0007EF62E9|nr:PREDICTED: putative germin-like protein 2-1 [Daucus carota subsp. sativus]
MYRHLFAYQMASSLSSRVLFIGLLSAMTCFVALAIDNNPLQDFCVGDPTSPVLVNGLVCKNPRNVTADDFFFSGLNEAGDTSNPVGSNVTEVDVDQVPGLNTLSIGIARIDYAPRGLNPPHIHPRATEILTVIKGQLRVGFVTSNPENRLIAKDLNEGDVFVFPEGLIHFQKNMGKGNAVAVSAVNSQDPGVITIANAVFGSNPNISPDIISKAFMLDEETVKELQARFD